MKKQSTVNTIVVIIVLTFIAKITGFVRDAFIGSRLGTSMQADAYNFSLNTTSMIFLSIGTGISLSLIPIIVEHIQNKELTNKTLNNIINALLLITIGITTIGMIVAPILIRSIASFEENFLLTVRLTQIMFPTLIFIVLAYIFVAYLQGNEIFVIPALISFPSNFIIIFYLFFLLKDFGVYGLALATLIGWIFQWIIQIPSARKVGFRYRLYVNFKDPQLKLFLISIVPIIFVTAIHQLSILMDNGFSSAFGDGNVSVIHYANQIYNPTVTVIVYGITAVMFPKFNKNIAGKDQEGFHQSVISVIKTLFFLLLPMTVGLVLLSTPLISMIYQRDQFDQQAVYLASSVLSAYTIGMIGFGIVDVINKAFYALKSIKYPVITGGVILTLNFILSIILQKYYGYVGIPYATALSFLLGSILHLYFYSKKVLIFRYSHLLGHFIKSLIAAMGMGVAVYYARGVFQKVSMDSLFLKQATTILGTAIIGVIVYFVLTLILKDDTTVGVMDQVRSRRVSKHE